MAHEKREKARIAQILKDDPSAAETVPCFSCKELYPKYAISYEIDCVIFDEGLCPSCFQSESEAGYAEYVDSVREEHPELHNFRGAKHPEYIDGVPHCAVCMEHLSANATECFNNHPIICQQCNQSQSNFCPNCGADLRSEFDHMSEEEYYEYRATSEEYRMEVMGYFD